MLGEWEFTEVTPYLVAVLGLLVVWQYYQMQIMAGRIMAIDIFDRSGIRMYIYLVPDDDAICGVCAGSNGRVFLPSRIAEKGFSPLHGQCQRPIPCPGTLIGLYGAWPEARGVVERARAQAKKSGVQLSHEELRALVNGQWEMSISAETDRLSVHMIESACYEKINRAVSITGYRYVIEEVKEVRHLLLLVPAYLRLALLLVRSGDNDAALALIDRFEARFPSKKRGLHFPTAEQRNFMKMRKSHLLGNQPEKIPA
ncbi:MAG: hypothetical protein FJ247_04995 [Nitrospira sp.]|nr:hypothetical protein [Nitrospira sp.]